MFNKIFTLLLNENFKNTLIFRLLYQMQFLILNFWILKLKIDILSRTLQKESFQ